MLGSSLSKDDKTHVLVWKQRNISIKEICHRCGRGKSTLMRLLAASRGLLPTVVPSYKPTIQLDRAGVQP